MSDDLEMRVAALEEKLNQLTSTGTNPIDDQSWLWPMMLCGKCRVKCRIPIITIDPEQGPVLDSMPLEDFKAMGASGQGG